VTFLSRPFSFRQLTAALLGLLAFCAVPPPAAAQAAKPNVGQMSIEDLLNIEVTSASRREQRAGDVPAAIFVITREDIRRSGMTTVPDLLRLAPGVDVAQVNGNKWAVSVRGFNGVYANKLLVLVDGRTVYNRLFSGVLWNSQDLMVDDIERIEVIRGPGAAIWGANAVNGVINIVTNTASETQGGLVRVDVGANGDQGALRYGASRGATSVRVFGQWTRRDPSLLASGLTADDISRSATAGFRADWTGARDQLMLEGSYTGGRTRALWPNLDPLTSLAQANSHALSTSRGGQVTGRWSRTTSQGMTFQVQSFVDVDDRHEPIFDYRRHVIDVDSQLHRTFGARHELVTGIGYRSAGESFGGSSGIHLSAGDDTLSLFTAFAQDDIAFFDRRVMLTLGSQVQYDSGSGTDVQPTVRALWKISPHQRLWAAASRAVRTPSLQDRRIEFVSAPMPMATGLRRVTSSTGNPAAAAERVIEFETGYRLEIGADASIDVTGFVGHYDHLRTQEVAAPEVRFDPKPYAFIAMSFANNLQATTRGLEISGHWTPSSRVRLDASYTGFRMTPRLAAGSTDPFAGTSDGGAPRSQWQLRTSFSPVTRATVDVAFFHVGRLQKFNVPAYTRADVHAEWSFTSRISLMAIGENLLTARHAEFGGPETLVLATQVVRSGSVRLRWSF
jgi:iron complex outermembrane receptor protein